MIGMISNNIPLLIGGLAPERDGRRVNIIERCDGALMWEEDSSPIQPQPSGYPLSPAFRVPTKWGGAAVTNKEPIAIQIHYVIN